MKYIRKSFFLFWLIAVMLFGTVSASAASAKPETPVLSGTAAGNRVTLNWNKVLVAVISFTVAVVITALCIKFRKKGQKSQDAENHV